MPDYTVKSCRLMHNKKTYEVGDPVNLKVEEAKPLIALGGLTVGGGAPRLGTLDVFVQDKIIAAINELDKGNQELWTKDKKPQTSAIEDVLGTNITAKERDAAWEAINSGARKSNVLHPN